MRTRTTTRRRTRRRAPERVPADTRPPVRAAAMRAVERVLSSEVAFGLLIRRLEEAGWHIEREQGTPAPPVVPTASLTPPARAR